MTVLMSRTLTVSIGVAPQKVYDFVSSGANLPKWAPAFCLSAKQSKDGWLVETPQGPVTIRLAPKNSFGVVDHDVIPAQGSAVHVPMRVIPNGSGTEVLFTLLKTPEMSDERFNEDMRLVQQDLATLKKVLETGKT